MHGRYIKIDKVINLFIEKNNSSLAFVRFFYYYAFFYDLKVKLANKNIYYSLLSIYSILVNKQI